FATIGLELINYGLSIPFPWSNTAPGCGSADGFNGIMWICAVVPTFIDVATFFGSPEKTIARGSKLVWGIVANGAMFLWGIAHFGLVIAKEAMFHGSTALYQAIEGLFSCVPELTAFIVPIMDADKDPITKSVLALIVASSNIFAQWTVTV